jgi:hypothetical protein
MEIVEQAECGFCARLIDKNGDPIPNTEFMGPGVGGDEAIHFCSQCSPKVAVLTKAAM